MDYPVEYNVCKMLHIHFFSIESNMRVKNYTYLLHTFFFGYFLVVLIIRKTFVSLSVDRSWWRLRSIEDNRKFLAVWKMSAILFIFSTPPPPAISWRYSVCCWVTGYIELLRISCWILVLFFKFIGRSLLLFGVKQPSWFCVNTHLLTVGYWL